MKIETRYSYEKVWQRTDERDILKIIEEEIGDADPKGTYLYLKEAISKGKVLTIGDCKFRVEKKG